MSRFVFNTGDGRKVVCGYDRPYDTFYAQLFDDEGADVRTESPVSGVGYHPDEQLLDPTPEYGPFPVPAADALEAYVSRAWNVHLPDNVYEALQGGSDG